jgi:hypothetical protein
MSDVNRTIKVVKPMSAPETPIACTLDGASYAKRIGAIGALFARSLKASRIDGNALHLTFDAAARADVEDLVRREKACCAFLDFRLTDNGATLNLAITAPRGVDAAELLAPFTPMQNAASCGCATKPPSKLTGAFTGLSFGAGAATLVCAASCGLAIALAAAGVGGAWLSTVKDLEAWWLPSVGVTVLLLALAWLVRRRFDGTQRELRALQIATLFALVGAAWGWIEMHAAAQTHTARTDLGARRITVSRN